MFTEQLPVQLQELRALSAIVLVRVARQLVVDLLKDVCAVVFSQRTSEEWGQDCWHPQILSDESLEVSRHPLCMGVH